MFLVAAEVSIACTETVAKGFCEPFYIINSNKTKSVVKIKKDFTDLHFIKIAFCEAAGVFTYVGTATIVT